MEIEKTQKTFDEYLNSISFEKQCKYMYELLGIVNLCNYPQMSCKFRKVDSFKSKGKEKHECTRADMARIKGILG